MKRQLLNISGDKDFILSDDGLLIYYNHPDMGHCNKAVTKFYISNAMLAQLHEQVPFDEIVKNYKTFKAEEVKTAKFWKENAAIST